MKQLKRLTSVLLVLGIVLGLMPLSAFAAEPANTVATTFTVTEPVTGGENTYNYTLLNDGTYNYTLLNDGTAELTGFLPGVSVADAVIPSAVKGHPVTSIGESAFASCGNLESVTLPDSIISIGTDAFSWCTALTTVNLGNSVVSIGTGAFGLCTALTTVNFGNSVVSIGDSAFAYCTSLESVTLPDSIVSIGTGAFSSCTDLDSVTIPSSVQTIGHNAFDYGSLSSKTKLGELHYTGTKAQWDELMNKEISYTFKGQTYTGMIGTMNPMLNNPENFDYAHTVSFDCGDPEKNTSKEVLYEGTVTPPADPTAEGYQFKGWYTQENNGELFKFDQKITKDVTVYAHWSKEYTLTEQDGTLVSVTFEKNGKTEDITKNVKLKKEGTTQIGKIPEGAMVTVKANAASGGWVFAQWNISDPALMENPDVAYTSQTMTFPMPAEDVAVCAQWSKVEPTTPPTPPTPPTTPTTPTPDPTPTPTPTPTPDPDPTPTPTPTPDPDTAKEYTMTEKDGSLVCVTVEKNGTIVDITKNVVLKKEGTTRIGKIPVGAMVTVAANAAPEGMVFAQWNISDPALMGDPDVAHTSQTMTFPMPAADVTVEAMYESAENARETELLGSAAMIGAVGISAVVLAYQAHQLGTELYLKYLLPSGAALPQNRIQLAELLWRNAGEPVPDVNAMYEDIGLNEEAAQQAAQWAVENELMELPDEEHTEQFKPDEQISYGEAIRAWKKAQQLKTAE